MVFARAPARVSPCSIILVHGTWGRSFFPKISDLKRRYLFRGSKRWFEDGSPFHERLKALGWPISAFPWSGANSVHARDSAARELSDQLREDLAAPGATFVIIAHSHGGNVALRTLQYLGSSADRIRVITLATPFLRVYPRKVSSLPLSANSLLWVGITTILILISIGVLSIEFRDSFVSDSRAVLLGLVFAALAAGMLIVYGLNKLFVNPEAADTIAEAADYQRATPRMLVLRGVDDEAALSLAAGSIGSRLNYLLLVGVLPWLYWIVFLLTLVLDSMGGSLLFKDSQVFKIIMVVCIFGAPLSLILSGAFKSAFGREFLLNAFECEISADSIPDTVNKVEAMTLPPAVEAVSFLQMRHGIYNHPQCVNEIMRWLRATAP